MYDSVLKTIEKYSMLNKGDKIVVGLSGGADSCSLVHILSRIKDEYDLDITAVHINHGIRGEEAKRDEDFARGFCKQLGIDFVVHCCNVPEESKKRGLGEEEMGRVIRYEKFRETAIKMGGAKIAVAHNSNDVAETLIMRLCRGSGLKGLSGIKPVNGDIIRPLLYCERSEIERYCENNSIKYCTDSTNLEIEYTRNKIRRILLPWLEKEINSSAKANIAKTAELIGEEEEYLEELATEIYKMATVKLEENKVILDLKTIEQENIVLQRRVIRIALRKFRNDLKDYSRVHIDSVLDIIKGDTGRSINLPGNINVTKSYSEIKVFRVTEVRKAPWGYEIPVGIKMFVKEIDKYILLSEKQEKCMGTYVNVCTKKIDYDKIKETIKLRTRCAGDTIGIKNGRKKLKDLFIDEKIPIDERNSIPVLACGNKVILVNNRLAVDFYIDADTERVLYIYIWEEV